MASDALYMLRVIVHVVGPAGTRGSTVVPTGEGLTVDHRQPMDGDALTGVGMFAGLEPDVRQRVLATAIPRSYRKGQILFVEHDPGESLIILRRGAIAIFSTSPSGERAVLTVVRPPEVIGEVSLLDASTRSASAEAIEDCQALALPRAAFMDLVHSNPRILDAVMRSIGALIRRLTEQNSDHVFLDLPGRVAKTLVRLAGESQAPMITIELNQSQLAEMAGGSRQSVNQAIGSFASRGWLRTEGRRIVVTDVGALRRRAGMAER
jgi:CRP-like cAMP-binding protein